MSSSTPSPRPSNISSPLTSSHPPPSHPPYTPTRPADAAVIAKLEILISGVLDGLLGKEDDLEILVRGRERMGGRVGGEEGGAGKEGWGKGGGGRRGKVRFPGRDGREGWRFVVLFRIVELVYRALVKGVVISKRNIYYQNPTLFKSQRVVDRYVDVLACSLRVQRAALNVTAAAKGLVAGNFTVTHADGTVTRNGASSATMIFSEIDDVLSIDISGFHWVLVIEKEAKGYPDLSTRAFLNLLSRKPKRTGEKFSPPIYALMDFDPDGISIMSTYKYGSWNLSHETAKHNVPHMRWLGVQSADLMRASEDNEPRHATPSYRGLIPMSTRDRGKAIAMLKKHPLMENGPEEVWRSELQVMLMLGYKAEMELIEDREGGLERWLDGKLIADKRACEDFVLGGQVRDTGVAGMEGSISSRENR